MGFPKIAEWSGIAAITGLFTGVVTGAARSVSSTPLKERVANLETNMTSELKEMRKEIREIYAFLIKPPNQGP